MKLSDQVVSLEIAKKLKSLGVKQDSYFYWQNIFMDEYKVLHAENDNCNQHNGPGDITWLNIQKRENKAWSAFTVSELGELLPAYTNINGDPCKLDLSKYIIPVGDYKGEINYSAEYWVLHDNHYRLGGGFYEVNEAEARGKMLIYLIENKIIEV